MPKAPMSGVWPWTGALVGGGLVVVAAVVAGWCWQRRMTARFGAWLKPILDADLEIQEFELMLRQAHARQEQTGD